MDFRREENLWHQNHCWREGFEVCYFQLFLLEWILDALTYCHNHSLLALFAIHCYSMRTLWRKKLQFHFLKIDNFKEKKKNQMRMHHMHHLLYMCGEICLKCIKYRWLLFCTKKSIICMCDIVLLSSWQLCIEVIKCSHNLDQFLNYVFLS